VALYKMTAFGVSSFYAGIGGGLFVFSEAVLGPATFDIVISLTMLAVLVLGGMASVLGSIFAAAIMTMRIEIVDTLVKLIPFGEEFRIDALRGAIYGGLLIVAIIMGPRGLAGGIRELAKIKPSAIIERVRSLRVAEVLRTGARRLLQPFRRQDR